LIYAHIYENSKCHKDFDLFGAHGYFWQMPDKNFDPFDPVQAFEAFAHQVKEIKSDLSQHYPLFIYLALKINQDKAFEKCFADYNFQLDSMSLSDWVEEHPQTCFTKHSNSDLLFQVKHFREKFNKAQRIGKEIVFSINMKNRDFLKKYLLQVYHKEGAGSFILYTDFLLEIDGLYHQKDFPYDMILRALEDLYKRIDKEKDSHLKHFAFLTMQKWSYYIESME